MAEFLSTYGYLMVSALLGSMLGISVYLPLMTGQLSLATPGFYSLGGYIAAVLSVQVFPAIPAGENFPITWLLLEMLLAGLASGVVAVIIGIPVLRLRGIYLAIATIALVEILRVLSLNLEITGGAVGIFGIPQPFEGALGYLWLVLPLLVGVSFFVWRLENIKVGRAFNAIREDELAANAMGIDPTRYKILAFVLGAILAGIVGAIAAHFLNTWNARQGTFDASITYLAFVLVGGSRSFLGPVVGGILLTALPELLRGLGDARLVFFGLLLLLGTIFAPQGLITPELLRRWLPKPLRQ